jgi:hypothetical protein
MPTNLVAVDSLLYTTSRLRMETFKQFLWWVGYRHNVKADEFLIASNTESPRSIFERNFYLCEHNYRYIYEHGTRAH